MKAGMHARVIEAIRAEIKRSGLEPNALYLGRDEFQELRAEIDEVELLDLDAGLSTEESMYAGLHVYAVDAQHHFNVAFAALAAMTWKSEPMKFVLPDGRTMVVVYIYRSRYSARRGSEGQEMHRDLDAVEVAGVSEDEAMQYAAWRIGNRADPNCVPQFMKAS